MAWALPLSVAWYFQTHSPLPLSAVSGAAAPPAAWGAGSSLSGTRWSGCHGGGPGGPGGGGGGGGHPGSGETAAGTGGGVGTGVGGGAGGAAAITGALG